MKRHQMLDTLNGQGWGEGDTFNDDPEVKGWFGWEIKDGLLTIRHESEDHTKSEASWRLEPVSVRD